MPRITVEVSQEIVEMLDMWAEEAERSRNFIANQLLESAIREKLRKKKNHTVKSEPTYYEKGLDSNS